MTKWFRMLFTFALVFMFAVVTTTAQEDGGELRSPPRGVSNDRKRRRKRVSQAASLSGAVLGGTGNGKLWRTPFPVDRCSARHFDLSCVDAGRSQAGGCAHTDLRPLLFRAAFEPGLSSETNDFVRPYPGETIAGGSC